ncbi:helix-turn-helix domain-containing protein [Mesonia maritima]|uniref:DNA-binding transcriptional regulator AlpA n=1 Tax=Mesonia maritima TaxID=1793873 RepID=A0ABU1K9I6_9FLAO|nr:helix-turn-helix domain-containing protein [Mesonia maritima]MDR6302274.1 putative DNA-binding transcriptional regulator AlpA [Mesonia maritima]
MKPKLMLVTEKGMQEFIPLTRYEELQTRFEKLSNEEKTQKAEKEKLYTMTQVLKIFKTSRPTIYAWEKKGILHPIRIEGRVYFKADDLDKMIDSKR